MLLGQLQDLDEAIAIGRRTLEATPTEDPNRPVYLANVGADFQARFDAAGALAAAFTSNGSASQGWRLDRVYGAF